MITFEEVKEMFKELIDATDTMNQALEHLIQSIYLKGYDEALAQEQRWIPCSERLPKKGEYDGDVAKYYLVQNEYGDMLVARYTHSEYWEQIYQLKPIADEIIAWCELPQPYTESENKQ